MLSSHNIPNNIPNNIRHNIDLASNDPNIRPHDAASGGTYSLKHLPDQQLLDGLSGLVGANHRNTATLLAHLAEVEARALYLPAACASMHVYCVRVLHLSEDAAYKRIRAARAARRFPAIFTAVAEGRLHLAAVVLLAPHFTDDNVDELIAAASYRTKAQIEVLLARRAPRPDLPPRLEPVPASLFEQLTPGPVAATPPATKTTPLAPQRFALQVTLGQETHDKLMRAQALLRHQVPRGELDKVLDHALDALLGALERRKFGATETPRAVQRATGSRHVPNHVRRSVHARDGEQCAFVSDAGERCTERGFLELDHVVAFARGGEATVPNTRLLCAAHNQYEARRTFGATFLDQRRAQAELEADAISALRGLGWSSADARRAVAESAHAAGRTLEGRIRAALAALRTRYTTPCSEGWFHWPRGQSGGPHRPG